MEFYDDIRAQFFDVPAEEKLQILRSESMRRLGTVSGHAGLMLKILEERKPPELPDDFEKWCKNIIDGASEMRDLIDALTDARHRRIQQQERADHERKFNEEMWEHDQTRVPELQQYKSFTDAVKETAQKIGSSLAGNTGKSIELHAPFHPSGYLEFDAGERRADVGTQSDGHLHLGYVITLRWCSDKRNIKWQEHKGLTKSLDEAVTVLDQWLIENWGLEQIKQLYPWF
jgi:hypothetical protein